jgi:TorA maturation chaperone TorD
MCGYCGASARIKFDDEQFAALFNELQARCDKAKLMQSLRALIALLELSRVFCYNSVYEATNDSSHGASVSQKRS